MLKKNVAKRLSRQELYDLVWSDPMTTIAATFGISDVALKKKCAAAMVPTPERGYWAKKEAGKPTTKLPLPRRAPGQDEVVIFGGDSYGHGSYDEAELLGPLPDPPEFSEPVEEVRTRISKEIGKVAVPREVHIWAAPIERLFAEDDKRREKQRDSPYPSPWDKPIFDSSFERRRLRILNALSVATAKMHGRLYIHGKEGRSVIFSVVDHAVSIYLDVPTKRGQENASVTWSPRPDHAEMVLVLGSGKSEKRWTDDAAGKIESKLTEIAIEIIVEAELQYRERRVRNYQWRVEQKAELEEAARKRKVEEERAARGRRERLEQARIDRLLEDATLFQQARDIRVYVEAIRQSELGETGSSTPALDKWCTWALAQADRIDPANGDVFLMSMDNEGDVGAGVLDQTMQDDVLLLRQDIARLRQENRMLQEQIAMLSRNATPGTQSFEDALREQRHNFFKYRNFRRY